MTEKVAEEKNTKSDELLPYYHGLLPREDVRQMLRTNGDYLLRTTEEKPGIDRLKCLSMMWQNVMHHFILNPNSAGHFSFDPAVTNPIHFPTIKELVSHYQDTKQTFSRFNAQLLNPIKRFSWEFRHTQVELGKRLGAGAFGDVYSGFLTISNKQKVPVAVKTLKCDKIDKVKIEEAMKEARLLRCLSHENIVKLYGVAADEEPLMIIMELINGGSLEEYLTKNSFQITLGERARMSLDACLAVEYIHSKGIIHRDIASRNCLYTKEALKLSDFGMSRAGREVQMLTTERVPVRWVAPEVFTTMKCTSAADIWALGVLIWEIYNNGQEPYSGWTAAQVRTEVVKNKYTLKMPEWCDQRIKDLLKRMWMFEPGMRVNSTYAADIFELIAKRNSAETESPASTYTAHSKYLTAQNEYVFEYSSSSDGKNDDGDADEKRKQKSQAISRSTTKKDSPKGKSKSKAKKKSSKKRRSQRQRRPQPEPLGSLSKRKKRGQKSKYQTGTEKSKYLKTAALKKDK